MFNIGAECLAGWLQTRWINWGFGFGLIVVLAYLFACRLRGTLLYLDGKDLYV